MTHAIRAEYPEATPSRAFATSPDLERIPPMVTSPTPQLRAPVVGGRYAVQRKLGTGSVGTVYLAHDCVERRPVALKVVRAERLLVDSVQGLRDEFRAIASLRHPHLAQALDFGYLEDGAVPYYTREFVDGEPLPGGPPPAGVEPEPFLRPILDLLEALEYLHENGILHLDVHAGNLIVSNESSRGSVLIDFGLRPSALRDLDVGSSDRWDTLPPEFATRGSVSERTDLYMTGQTLEYRLTGRTSGAARLPPEIPGWGARRTLAIERVLAKALQRDPDRRFATATEFRTALSRAVGATESPHRRGEPIETLVGRTTELSRLDTALRDTAAGRPAVLWAYGASGVGKSRWISEARLLAQLRGLTTVTGRFGADPDVARTIASAIEATSGSPDASSWADALDPGAGGSPSDRARRAVEGFFLDPGEPIALLADDVDAAEGASRALIDAFVNESARRIERGLPGRGLCLVLTSTVAPNAPASPFALELGPLSDDASRRLLDNSLLGIELPDALARRAIRLSAWSAAPRCDRSQPRGAKTSPARAESRRPPPFPISPAKGRPSKRETWARLGSTERRVLETLRFVGREMSLGELMAALGGTRSPRFPAALARLERIEWIENRGDATGDEAPRNEATGDEATGDEAPRYEAPRNEATGYETSRYRLQLDAESQSTLESRAESDAATIDRRLVAYLETTLRVDRADDPEALTQREHLAEHVARSEPPDVAADRAVEAAEFLRRSGRLDRAVALLNRVLEILGTTRDDAPHARIADLLSDLCEATGDHLRGAAVLAPLVEDVSRGQRGIGRTREIAFGGCAASGRIFTARAKPTERSKLSRPHASLAESQTRPRRAHLHRFGAGGAPHLSEGSSISRAPRVSEGCRSLAPSPEARDG